MQSGTTRPSRSTHSARVSSTLNQRQSAFIRLLLDVTATANAPLPAEQALQQALAQIGRHTGWPVTHMYLPDPHAPGELMSAAIWSTEHPERFRFFRTVSEATRFAAGQGLVGQVQATARPVWASDVQQEPRFIRGQDGRELGVRAGVLFPILIGEDVAGVLECFAPEAVEADVPQLTVLANVGTILGRVLERERMRAALEQQETERRVATEAIIIALSHEINNPLYAARAALAVLQGEPAGTEADSPLLEVIRVELARLADVMQRVRYSV